MAENIKTPPPGDPTPKGINPLKRRREKLVVTVQESKAPRAPGELPPWQAKTVAVARGVLSGSASAYRNSVSKLRSLRRAGAPCETLPTNVAEGGVAEPPAMKARFFVKTPTQEAASAVSASTAKAPLYTSATATRRVADLATQTPSKLMRFAQYVEDVADLPARSTVVLYGDAVSCSMEKELEEGMVEQPSRLIVPLSKVLQAKGEYPTRINVYIRGSMLRACADKNLKITIALDYFIQYGLKVKRSIIVVGGGHGVESEQTQVDLLIFRDGRLQKLTQRGIHARTAKGSYVPSLTKTIEAEYTRAEGVQAVHVFAALIPPEGYVPKAPVPSPVVTIDHGLFAKPIVRRINYGFRLSSPVDVLVPAAIVAGAAVASVGTLYLDSRNLSSSQQDFKKAIAGHISDYAQGQASLGKLALKKEYMTQDSPQIQGTSKLHGLIEGALEGEGTFIRKIELRVSPWVADPAAPAAQPPPDFKLTLVVPEKADQSGLEQGHPILQSISKTTGAECTLLSQAGETVDGGRVRVFEIEGRFPSPAS